MSVPARRQYARQGYARAVWLGVGRFGRTGGAADRRLGGGGGGGGRLNARGALSEQKASEANEAATGGLGGNSPGEPLTSNAGAAATAAKDMVGSMLGKAAPRQRGDVAPKMRGRPTGRWRAETWRWE